jgi:RHS repeat-associated protein
MSWLQPGFSVKGFIAIPSPVATRKKRVATPASARYIYNGTGNMRSGAMNGVPSTTYRFSTKGWDDDSRLYYFGARYYYPEIGRWTQRDPAGTVDSLNLYLYLNNGPVSW